MREKKKRKKFSLYFSFSPFDPKEKKNEFCLILQKLIILDPQHIFPIPICGKGECARGITIGRRNF